MFRVNQAPDAFNFHWVDQSFCEQSYQFERNGTALEEEFIFQSDCFEKVETASGSTGDPLLAVDENDEPIFPVGRKVTYCMRAVGPPVGEAESTPYQSAKACHSVRVKHVGVVTGRVSTMADTTMGIPHVMITAYLLTQAEHSAKEDFQDVPVVHAWDFSDPDKESFVAIFNTAWGLARSRRSTIRTCPEVIAEDSTGLPMYTSFAAADAGTTVNATCPAIGNEIPAPNNFVFRTCSASGNWGPVDGSCPDPLRYFKSPEPKFIKSNNLEITATARVIENTDERACAWICMTQAQECRSFEIFRSGLQPRCYISSLSSRDNDVTFVASKFKNMDYYEVDNLIMKEVTSATVYDHPVDNGLSCSIDTIADANQWPSDPASVGPYLASNQHLKQLGARGCNHIQGSLVIRCRDSCEDRVGAVWELFGSTAKTNDIAAFCSNNGAPSPSIDSIFTEVQSNCYQYSVIQSNCCTNDDTSVDAESRTCSQRYDANPEVCGSHDVTGFAAAQQCCACGGGDTVTPISQLPSQDDYRVTSLVWLKSIKTVTGIVEISGCDDLIRFDGGLGQLRQVTGLINGAGPIDIRDNRRLTGNLHRVLPALPLGSIKLGQVSGNPELCVPTAESRFVHHHNADPNDCGCTQIDSPHFSMTADHDDGSCDSVQCDDCYPGTYGRCSYQSGIDRICVPMQNDSVTGELGCPTTDIHGPDCIGPSCVSGFSTSLCDLCADIVTCDTPPNCRSAAGVCAPTTGRCEYTTLLSTGDGCSDGNPFTGPDLCTVTGECVTTKECSVGKILDIYEQPSVFGVTILTQSHLNKLDGCGTIGGNLNIDCSQGSFQVPNSDPISDFLMLRSVVRITGMLRIVNCQSSQQPNGPEMPNLKMVGGGVDGFGVIIEDTSFTGTLDSLFPALKAVDGGVKLARNLFLCTNTFDWFDAFEIANNRPIAECGCTDSRALNYDSNSQLVEDGSCVFPPCLEDCVDSDLEDCKVPQCNERTGACEYIDQTDAGVACNDHNDFTADDVCAMSSAGAIDCIGEHVCDDSQSGLYCNSTSTRHELEKRPVVNTNINGCGSAGCSACEGDCDSDSECAGNLVCFERTSSSQTVPGCESTGYQTVTAPGDDWDYCHDPGQYKKHRPCSPKPAQWRGFRRAWPGGAVRSRSAGYTGVTTGPWPGVASGVSPRSRSPMYRCSLGGATR